MDFHESDTDIKFIGQGGNNKVYLLIRDYKGFGSAVIKAPQSFIDISINKFFEVYVLLKRYGITTTAFLEECTFNGKRAVITENLHKPDYTYIDANPHLESEFEKQLRLLDEGMGISHSQVKEPEEERKFADRKFKEVTNIVDFANRHINTLKQVSVAHIYLEYDCYFYKVKNAEITDIDYIIADWDNIYEYNEPNLFEKNKEEFKTSLGQFLMWYVVEDKAKEYEKVIMGL